MKKLAIVNGAPTSEMLAPFNDPEWEVWVLGNRCQRYPRYDRIFEIHDDLAEHGDPQRYAEWLAGLGTPMVVGEAFPVSAPHIQRFDFAAAKALFGRTYLTSSTVYMVCQALLEGYTHVRLFGVDMAVDEHEYFWQRPCLEAWLGFARGRGVDIDVHETSPAFKSDYIEGMGRGGKPDFSCAPFTSRSFDAVANKHRQHIAEKRAQIDALMAQIHTHNGAIQAYERMQKVARAIEMGNKVENIEKEVVIR